VNIGRIGKEKGIGNDMIVEEAPSLITKQDIV